MKNTLIDTYLSSKPFENMKDLIEISPMAEPFSAEENNFATTAPIAAPILESLQTFLETVPAYRLNKGLRKMLIDYLFYNIEALPVDFEELLGDFYWLTNFLDKIHEEGLNKAD